MAEDKIEILLRFQKITTDQMAEIKREEMSWLKVFLLFYGAVVAWILGRWFDVQNSETTTISQTQIANDSSLLVYIIWFSFIATLMFAYLFIHTRHSYYDVSKRLHKIQKHLGLFNNELWDGESFLPVYHRTGKITSVNSWIARTKPGSSFLTRLVYIFGANLGVDYLCFNAMGRIGQHRDIYFISFYLFLNLIAIILIYLFDYLYFRTRKLI